MKMSGGIGNPGIGSAYNCEDCIRIRKIRKIEDQLHSQISIIRESVEQSTVRLRRECEETIQHLEKDAAEKIESIKKGD